MIKFIFLDTGTNSIGLNIDAIQSLEPLNGEKRTEIHMLSGDIIEVVESPRTILKTIAKAVGYEPVF